MPTVVIHMYMEDIPLAKLSETTTPCYRGSITAEYARVLLTSPELDLSRIKTIYILNILCLQLLLHSSTWISLSPAHCDDPRCKSVQATSCAIVSRILVRSSQPRSASASMASEHG
jgi:hypothetical protein